MLNGRSQKWLMGVLLSTLMLFLVVFAYMARKPLCIDSKLVERIDSISPEGTAIAYRCGLHRQVPYNEELAQQMPALNRRLQQVDQFLEWLGPLPFRVNLTVIRGDSQVFHIHGQEIQLGESILKARGQIEKAFLRMWFRQKAHPDLRASGLIEESLTDFLYFALQGDWDLQAPGTLIALQQDVEARWPRVLSQFQGYCRSLWRSNEDFRICEDLRSFADDEINLMSLRPLISLALMDSYKALEPEERVLFLKSLAASMKTLRFHEKDFGLTPTEPGKQSYFAAISQLEKWIYFFNEISESVVKADKFAALFELQLKKRGYDRNTQLFLLDTLIFADDLSVTQRQGFLAEMDTQKQLLIGLESKGSLQMTSQEESLNSRLIGTVRASTGVLLNCGVPAMRKMAELAQRVDRLLFVHYCENQIVYLKGYFEKGVMSFAMQNPGIKFAELHLPSYLLAIQKIPGLNPIQLLKDKKKDLLRPLGWSEPRYDETVKAFKAQSAIELVDWYRL